jgi:hypothetical protein
MSPGQSRIDPSYVEEVQEDRKAQKVCQYSETFAKPIRNLVVSRAGSQRSGATTPQERVKSVRRGA